MNNTAEVTGYDPVATLNVATVQHGAPPLYKVVIATGPVLWVKKATSCLVTPVVGDQILLSVTADNAWIIAILSRAPEHTLELASEQNLTIKAGQQLTLAGEQSVAVRSCTIQLASQWLGFAAQCLSGRCHSIDWVSQKVSATLDNLTLTAKRLLQKLQNSCRFIEGHDETTAGSVRQTVASSHVLHSENMVHTASKHVKIDAEQIHLG